MSARVGAPRCGSDFAWSLGSDADGSLANAAGFAASIDDDGAMVAASERAGGRGCRGGTTAHTTAAAAATASGTIHLIADACRRMRAAGGAVLAIAATSA